MQRLQVVMSRNSYISRIPRPEQTALVYDTSPGLQTHSVFELQNTTDSMSRSPLLVQGVIVPVWPGSVIREMR
jgi:hypothetical protein